MAESCLLTGSGLDFTIHSAYSSCVCGPSVSFGQNNMFDPFIYIRLQFRRKIVRFPHLGYVAFHGGLSRSEYSCKTLISQIRLCH